jgi:hypothetical protein
VSEPWKDELEKGTADFMWAMFRKGNQKANLMELEELCQRLIRMASQKTTGQRNKPGDLDWGNLGMLYNMIAIEATCLVLDPRFDKLKEEWETDD